jgi:CDP-paratose 2-epimerase
VSGPVLITGGAGFIGSNLAHRLLSCGERVRLLDNLSRASVERNVEWLRHHHTGAVELCVGDVRNRGDVAAAVRGASSVFHLAAQVAVTTSLVDPIEDFEVNARGTLNVLEALRTSASPPPLVLTSTNKVYGALGDVALEAGPTRYDPCDGDTRQNGVGERRPLDLYSPYGCSKGAADQYTLDYARTFGLRAVVFRMSCIYGPRQFGTEDQGWVAYFLLRALGAESLTVYGDGKQVRDVLYVDDLVDALLLARGSIGRLSGRPFNIGGGPGNAVSLLELLGRFSEGYGLEPEVRFAPWRPGDQRYYVSDVQAFGCETGWAPRVGIEEGLRRLHAWLLEVRARPGGARPSAVGVAP